MSAGLCLPSSLSLQYRRSVYLWWPWPHCYSMGWCLFWLLTFEHNPFQVGNERKVFMLFTKSSSYSYNHLFSIGEYVWFDKYEKQTHDSIQRLSYSNKQISHFCKGRSQSRTEDRSTNPEVKWQLFSLSQRKTSKQWCPHLSPFKQAE